MARNCRPTVSPACRRLARPDVRPASRPGSRAGGPRPKSGQSPGPRLRAGLGRTSAPRAFFRDVRDVQAVPRVAPHPPQARPPRADPSKGPSSRTSPGSVATHGPPEPAARHHLAAQAQWTQCPVRWIVRWPVGQTSAAPQRANPIRTGTLIPEPSVPPFPPVFTSPRGLHRSSPKRPPWVKLHQPLLDRDWVHIVQVSGSELLEEVVHVPGQSPEPALPRHGHHHAEAGVLASRLREDDRDTSVGPRIAFGDQREGRFTCVTACGRYTMSFEAGLARRLAVRTVGAKAAPARRRWGCS